MLETYFSASKEHRGSVAGTLYANDEPARGAGSWWNETSWTLLRSKTRSRRSVRWKLPTLAWPRIFRKKPTTSKTTRNVCATSRFATRGSLSALGWLTRDVKMLWAGSNNRACSGLCAERTPSLPSAAAKLVRNSRTTGRRRA